MKTIGRTMPIRFRCGLTARMGTIMIRFVGCCLAVVVLALAWKPLMLISAAHG